MKINNKWEKSNRLHSHCWKNCGSFTAHEGKLFFTEKMPDNKHRKNGRLQRITICNLQLRDWLRQGPAMGTKAIWGRKRMLHKDSRIPQIASQLTLTMERTGCHRFNQLTKLHVIKRGQPDVRVVWYHTAHSIAGEVATPKTSHRNLLKPWPRLPVGMAWGYRLNGTMRNQTKPQCRTFHQTGLGS